MLDAGRPGPLSDTETHEDALGFVRLADGTGDGSLRRDMGALELQPPALGAVTGNVLSNAGAEAGTPADDDTSSPAPPQWSRSGSFTFVRYGTVAGNFPFPSRRIGEALGAGDAFFTAGPGKGNTATQVVQLGEAAPEIDLGQGSAALSALLGGYRASADAAIVEAEYRDPAGRPLGRLFRSAPSRPRPRRRDEPAPALDLGRDAAAHPLDRGDPALGPRRRRLRRRLLRLARARPARRRRRPAPRPRARRRQAAAPVRRAPPCLPPRGRRPPPPRLGQPGLRGPRRAAAAPAR